MRRVIPKLLIGACGLCLAAVTMPEHPRPEPAPLVQPPGTAPASWLDLEQVITAQARWYAAAASHPVVTKLPSSTPRSSGTHRGYGSAEECIAATENGGDYGRSSNPSHFGRYQFSRSTWAAYGGNPDDWGNASPEEQDRVFNNAVESGGLSNWTPYDGC